jgi:predicted nucleotidyltransferase
VGERTSQKNWSRDLSKIIEEIKKKFIVEAIIIFGSWSRSGGGDWSDIDLLVVAKDLEKLSILERFSISAEYKRYRIDLFLYTYEELESMALKGNPLILSALLEGIFLEAKPRVIELRNRIREIYIKKGRTWIRIT